MSFGIDKAMRRKGAIVGADPQRHSGLRGVTQDLSRRLVHGATIELLTEALHKLVTLCYEHDRAGFVNICSITGRLLIPAPMGRAGRVRWGLYPSEGIALGIILRERQAAGVALFVYDRSRRAWLVNLEDFHNRRTALAYLKSFPISVEEFRLAYAKAVG
jgi:hypothetical protein